MRGKERTGKESTGKKRKGKERTGKERKGEYSSILLHCTSLTSIHLAVLPLGSVEEFREALVEPALHPVHLR